MLTAFRPFQSASWELFRQLARRNLEQRHRGSLLGRAWLVLNPLLLTGIYVFVFTFVLPNPFARLDQILHVASIVLGLGLFNCVVEPLNFMPALIVRNPNYVRKVVFPLELLCLAEYPAVLLQFVISAGVVLALIVVGGGRPGLNALWLLPLLGSGLLLSAGLSLAIASLGVFIRDLETFMQQFTRIILYTSAVFYPMEKVPGLAGVLVRLNPLAQLVDATRAAVLLDQPPSVFSLVLVTVAGLLAFLGGLAVFRALRPQFADFV